MECPYCKSEESKVLESRSADDSRSIRRRRECLVCLKRFTTYERVELTPIIVIKRSGSREVYSRDKLLASIVRSSSKAHISALTIEEIVERVEARMYQDFSREIKASLIGQMVMEELKKIDPMAYLRYASIFKKINSISEFVQEMKSLDELYCLLPR
ncbi:MAG: transcriptional regulator NrdR [Cyanobacteriota bacterium]